MEYFLRIAHAVAQRSSCLKRKCGAVIVVDGHIVSTGYNGTPEGARNCNSGGCTRCSDTSLRSGEGFEACLCAHAERNAIYFAARHGSATQGGTMFCTLRPCLWCVEACIQAGIGLVVYGEDWPSTYKVPADYDQLLGLINITKVTGGGQQDEQAGETS